MITEYCSYWNVVLQKLPWVKNSFALSLLKQNIYDKRNVTGGKSIIRKDNRQVRTDWTFNCLKVSFLGSFLNVLSILSGTHNCPDGWVRNDQYCYQINAHPNQKLSFSDAQKLCHAFNTPWKDNVDVAKAELVSITSQEEHDFLDRTFFNYGIRGLDDYYWVGLEKDAKNNFHWTDGSKFVFQDWVNTVASNESCVKSSAYTTSKNSWRHAPCDEKHYFVCKVKRGTGGFLLLYIPYLELHYIWQNLAKLFIF